MNASARRGSALFGPGARRGGAAALALVLASAIWFCPADLAQKPRLALVVFALAIVGWTLTRIDDTTVALAAGVAFVLGGVVPKDRLDAALGHELIWLILAAFIIAAVLRETGVTQRLVLAAVRPVRTVAGLGHALTLVIAATAFVIPSTTGRAAMLLPVFLTLADEIDDPRITRALALLFPSVVLLSACGSLLGAGAHLVALGFMPDGRRVGFLRWMALALPFALLSSHAAAAAILHLFLTAEERRARLRIPAPPPGDATARQAVVAGVVAVTVVLWATVPLHGVGMGVVGLGAALVLTVPAVSGVPLKPAVRAVEWELVLFLAAAFLIGDGLIQSGAAGWIAQALLAAVPGHLAGRPAVVVGGVALLALLAHLVIVSRSARAAVLIPAVALPASGFGYDPVAVVMLTVLGTGFAQTFKFSAKSMAIYGTLDRPTYAGKDLLSLAAVLLPVMLVLLMVMALFIWPHMGLPLRRGAQ